MAVDAQALGEIFAPHLDHMTAEDRAQLAAVIDARHAKAGERLLSHGANSDRLFFVVDGTVDITLDCRSTTLKLATRRQGEWVGELGMIDPGPASAHVDVAEDAELWELTHAAFDTLRAGSPGAAASLLEMVSRDIAARLRECDTLVFHREDDRLVIPIHPEGKHESLLDRLKALFGLRGS